MKNIICLFLSILLVACVEKKSETPTAKAPISKKKDIVNGNTKSPKIKTKQVGNKVKAPRKKNGVIYWRQMEKQLGLTRAQVESLRKMRIENYQSLQGKTKEEAVKIRSKYVSSMKKLLGEEVYKKKVKYDSDFNK